MTAWVRGGALAGASELIKELGGDPAALARQAGVDESAFRDPEFPVRMDAVVEFMELAATACRHPSFGLLLSQRQEMTLFGPLWPFLQQNATIGDFVADLAAVFPLHTQGAVASVQPEGDGIWATFELAAGYRRSHRQIVELGLGVLVREIRRHEPKWQPDFVLFRHASPRDQSLHRRVFGAGITFDADRNAVFLSREILSCRFGSGDKAASNSLSSELAPMRRALASPAASETETAVRALLPFGPCDLDAVAHVLRLHPRSLQRRLAAEEASFATILDRVRADLALYYVRDSRLSAAAVAEILQFSGTSALSRAFRRWYGGSLRAARAHSRPGREVSSRVN